MRTLPNLRTSRWAPFLTVAALAPLLQDCGEKKAEKPNVLLICVDDLRPELGCYGKAWMHTPNLDRLAAQGILFERNYANVPTCGASRFNLITGLFPRNPDQVDNDAIRRTISEPAEGETVPENFILRLKNHGWYTMGIGKISHYSDGYLYGYNDPQGTRPELPGSWNEWMLEKGQWESGWKAFFGYADGSDRNSMKNQVKPYECADVPDTVYPDGLMARRVVQRLDEWTRHPRYGQPFLMAVGFFRPHLPFNSPKKYWDLYDEDSLPLTPVPGLPEKVSRASLHNSPEFNSYKLGDEAASLDQPLSDEYARKLRHAYFAAISYVDAQIGLVLDELSRTGLDRNTVVILWGDHGWHLGDLRMWGKHTLFDWALRSSLIMRVPGQKPGLVSVETVSTVDIYPTLMELCGIAPPTNLDGRSLVPLIRQTSTGSWNGQAFSWFKQGVSVRNDRYRYTHYFRSQEPVIELYDHQVDPNESRNLADENKGVAAEMEREEEGLWKYR